MPIESEKDAKKRTEYILIRVTPIDKNLIEKAVRLKSILDGETYSVSSWSRDILASEAMRYLVKHEKNDLKTDLKSKEE